jgi:hypothetical protein
MCANHACTDTGPYQSRFETWVQQHVDAFRWGRGPGGARERHSQAAQPLTSAHSARRLAAPEGMVAAAKSRRFLALP